MTASKTAVAVVSAPVPQKVSILAKMAGKFSVEPAMLQKTLADTVFKGATQEQTVALLIVADQYGLNPFTKEIYAFPAKGGGIVPVVGIDGWLRVINEHPQFDGMDFEQDEEQCTCKIFRKDRTRPIVVTEYHSECSRDTDPWRKCPKRMLRHKAIMQCARVAFGLVGIHDEEDARTIVDAEIVGTAPLGKPKVEMPKRKMEVIPDAVTTPSLYEQIALHSDEMNFDIRTVDSVIEEKLGHTDFSKITVEIFGEVMTFIDGFQA